VPSKLDLACPWKQHLLVQGNRHSIEHEVLERCKPAAGSRTPKTRADLVHLIESNLAPGAET
jgi:hypothetical protein